MLLLLRPNSNKKTAVPLQNMISILLSKITKFKSAPKQIFHLESLEKKSVVNIVIIVYDLWLDSLLLLLLLLFYIFHQIQWSKIYLHSHCWVCLLCLLFISKYSIAFPSFLSLLEHFLTILSNFMSGFYIIKIALNQTTDPRQPRKIWIDWVVNDHTT